jgi:NADPH:quinone reductase-like Zn-dependent oxidoreductase
MRASIRNCSSPIGIVNPADEAFSRRHAWVSLTGTALITGGNSGIGLATAKQFVKEGAYVFITGRREPDLAKAVKEIGSNVTGVQGDVSL